MRCEITGRMVKNKHSNYSRYPSLGFSKCTVHIHGTLWCVIIRVEQATSISGGAARCCYFLPEWRQSGCSLVNCGGRRDASRLHRWPVFSLESWSRLPEGKCYWFSFFPYLFCYFSLRNKSTRLVRGQPPQNPTFSIKPVFPHGYQQCCTWTVLFWVLFWVWIFMQPSVWLWRGGIRESAGKTNPFPVIWESHGFVVSFRRCSCNPTLPRSQVRSHPLLPLPPSAR